MSLAFQHAFSRMVLLLFSFGMQDYGFWRFWNNTESNSTSEGRGEAKQNNCEGQTVPLAIQHVFLGSGFIVFLSFGMRNFVPRLSPKNTLKKFTYWYTTLYATKISFAWEINILRREISRCTHKNIWIHFWHPRKKQKVFPNNRKKIKQPQTIPY